MLGRQIIVILLFFTASAIEARSWSDLDADEHEIYGREREEKLPVRLFFIQKERWAEHESFHFFFFWGDKNYPKYKSDRILPFYYTLESKIDNRALLFTPLYYQERDGGSFEQFFLWLFYRGANSDTHSYYHSLAPLYYYSNNTAFAEPFLLTPLFIYTKSPDNSRFLLTPLGYDSSDSDGVSRSLLWLYYYGKSFSAPNNYHALIPLYYYSRHADSYHAGILTPIVWIWGDAKRNNWFIFPLFYSATSDGTATRISPLYIQLTDANDRLHAFIPFYINYESPTSSFHLNLSGVSFSEERLNTAPIGITINKDMMLVDADVGWFYNLFRISTRRAIYFKQATENTAIAPEQAAVELKQKRARTRADSETFWGIYSLFGVLAYERADHYRHFRLLPLSWLTWDERNDSGIQTFLPFYVHYRDDDTDYLVLAPIYGRQLKRQGECTSETSAWFVILYWDSFACVTQKREITILWPLISYYTAPTNGGFLLFPVFWKTWQKNGAGESTSHISPLYLWFNDPTEKSFYSWVFYYQASDTHTSYGIPLLLHRKSYTNGNYHNFYLFPYYHSVTTDDANRSENVTWLFPLYYLRSADDNYTAFILGYYRERRLQYANDNFLLLLGYDENAANASWGFNAMLYTLHYKKASQSSSFKALYGLLASYSRTPAALSWHLALVTGYKSYNDGSYLRHHFLPLWWYSRTNENTTHLLLPFIASYFSSNESATEQFQAVLFGALYYKNSHLDSYEQTEHVLLGILYYHSKTAERHFDSYGSLWGGLWHYEREENYNRFSLLTFVYTRTETEQGVKHRFFGISL